MELGSLVCTPREPACERCPLGDLCRARQRGQQEQIPAARQKPAIEDVREAAVVVWRGDKILLRRCAHGERWAGLWDFVRFPLDARRNPALRRELVRRIREQTGLQVRMRGRIAMLKHSVTRFRITLDCYAARSPAGNAKLAAGTWRWVRPEELDEYALSTTGRKVAGMLQDTAPT